MKIIVTLLFAFAIYSNCASQPNEKWDLDKCLGYAIKNNLSIKRADIQAKQAALQLKQAKLTRYPNATFSTILGDQSGRSVNPITYTFTTIELLTHSYQFSGSMLLYNYGKLKNNIKEQEYNNQASLLDVDKTANNISLNIIGYYLQILANAGEIKIHETQAEQTLKQLAITKAHFEAGKLPELNIFQLQTQLASDSTDFLTARESFQNNLLILKSILGLDEAYPFEISVPDFDKLKTTSLSNLQPEIIFNSALKQQPEQKSDDFKIKAANLNIKITKASFYPVLSFGYNIATAFSNYISGQPFGKWWQGYGNQLNNNSNEQVAVTLSIPIFNNGRSHLGYEQAKLNLQDMELQQQQDNQQLKNNVYTTFSNATIAFEKINTIKKMVEGSQKTYNILFDGYEAGGINIIDLINSQATLTKAKLQLLNAQYDYAFKVKLLEFYNGKF